MKKIIYQIIDASLNEHTTEKEPISQFGTFFSLIIFLISQQIPKTLQSEENINITFFATGVVSINFVSS